MSQAFIDFDGIFNQAVEETETLMKLGFDISDRHLVTSLEWIANKHPEIADRCNQKLLELIDKQAAISPKFLSVSSNEDSYSF